MRDYTREKISEAQYFLDQMKTNYYKNNGEFRKNLTAFLSSLRSITDYMGNQYSKYSGFKQWKNGKITQIQNDPDLVFVINSRNKDIHVEYTKVTTTNQIEKTSAWAIRRKDGSVHGPPNTEKINPEKRTITRRAFNDRKDKEIINFCETQLQKIIQIVDECETLFL